MKKKSIKWIVVLLLCLFSIPLLVGCESEPDTPPVVEVEKVRVQFNSNGGTLVATQEIEKGAKLTKPVNPIRTNYLFKGWYLDSNYTNEWNFESDIVSDNITLHAKWVKKDLKQQYTVTFDAKGGSSVAAISNVESGTKITKPKDPTKTDYTFGGWYKDSNCTDVWNFESDAVAANVTLYAKWTAVETYAVTFDSKGGSSVTAISNVKSGTKITKPTDPTKTDFKFEGWYKSDPETDSHAVTWNFESDTVTANVTLYAKWSATETYVVTFVDMQQNVLDTIEVQAGASVDLPQAPEVSGYYFIGWKGTTTNITSNVTIQATYLRKPTASEIQNCVASTEVVFEGQVVAKSAASVLLMDTTGFVLVYGTATNSLQMNEHVRLKGTVSSFGGKMQLTSPKEMEVLGELTSYHPTIVDFGDIDTYVTNYEVGDYIECYGTLTKNGTHYNLNIGGSYLVSIAYPTENLDKYVNQSVTLYGYALYLNYSYLNILLDFIQPDNEILYNVQFLDESGKLLKYATVYEGDACTPPVAPIKDGYNFVGWVGGDYQHVTEDMILRPQYQPNNSLLNLSILEVNDLHGYLEQENGTTGISNLAYLIKTIRNENALDDVVLIGNGDMFQGTGISNITRGKAVVDCMNAMGFDAMGIGNHEFDWGLDEILKFFDGDTTNGEANFPLLNANVYLKATNELVMLENGNIFQYRIVDKSGVQVAILSYIGNIISSIAHERSEAYYFDNNIASSVQQLATPLKENGLADIVVVNIHDGETTGAENYSVNVELAALTYSKGWLVDAVINGHTHTRYTGMISRDGVAMPVVQAQSYCRYLGRIDLSIDMTTKKVVSADSQYLSNYGSEYDTEVQAILDQAVSEIDNEQFCVLGDAVSSTSDLQKWHGYTAIQATGADVFISNVGGIRATGGIQQGKIIDLFQIYEISPFDNVLYLMTAQQSQVANLLSSSAVFYITRNDMALEDNQQYTYAIISYVYFWSQLDTVRSSSDIQTDLVIRDLLIEDLRYRRDHQIGFYPVTNPNSMLENQLGTNPVVLMNYNCDLYALSKKRYGASMF